MSNGTKHARDAAESDGAALEAEYAETIAALRWLYQRHGLRCEPSGAIAVAAALTGKVALDGTGDVVIVVSGRNVDEANFSAWIGEE